MNERSSQTNDADEQDTVRLLRLAGPRPPAPDARAARVREAVHRNWQTASRRRVIRRRAFWGAGLVAAAAAVVLIAGRAIVVERPVVSNDRAVAVVERIEGKPRRASGISGSRAAELSPQDVIRTGDWIETDANARVAMRFPDGTSVRLDVGSRVRPVSADALELSSGAVYVDTGRASGRFEIRTAVAIARDIGTQFEVRLVRSIDSANPTLRLRVRTGMVELQHGTRSVSGRAGTEVTLSSSDTVSRPLAPHGPEWDWVAGLAPPLEFEGRALSAFLARVALEHGWDVQYDDPRLAAETSGIVLHGSVNGLAPREALDVAIATSGLRYRLESGTLLVMRGTAPKK